MRKIRFYHNFSIIRWESVGLFLSIWCESRVTLTRLNPFLPLLTTITVGQFSADALLAMMTPQAPAAPTTVRASCSYLLPLYYIFICVCMFSRDTPRPPHDMISDM